MKTTTAKRKNYFVMYLSNKGLKERYFYTEKKARLVAGFFDGIFAKLT